MLAKHHLTSDTITKVLQQHYGLSIKNIEFLPIGNDANARVYQVDDINNKKYFLKLNKGSIQKAGIKVPYYLHFYGINGIIPPITTKKGNLWAIDRRLYIHDLSFYRESRWI